jgi:multiple sugar transport system permease protein
VTRTAPRSDTAAPRVPAASRRPAARTQRRPSWARAFFYALLVVIAVVYVFPFVIQLATSFKTDADAAANPLSPIPNPFTTDAFTELFTRSDFPRWTANSVIIAVLVTVCRVFLDSLAGYALARLKFRGRGVVFAAVVAVMAVPGVVLLIPRFLVVNQLGMYNSYAGMIIPLIADAAGVFIMKNFFESIPPSIEEAARIDGAGTFRIFWSIILPMARPALITLIILSFQGSWNELTHFIVSRSDPDLNTLTTGVAALAAGSLGQGSQYPLKLAAALIMTIPVAVLFFLFQKKIMSTAEGAVKE